MFESVSTQLNSELSKVKHGVAGMGLGASAPIFCQPAIFLAFLPIFIDCSRIHFKRSPLHFIFGGFVPVSRVLSEEFLLRH